MSDIQVTARLKIHDGQLENFKKAAADCMESVRTKDTGTRQYDWFFNADQTECIVREHYDSSDAVLQHMGNLGEALGALLGTADLALEVYGAPSAELAEAASSLDVEVFSSFQSM